jgi:hypothetical protein
MFGIGLCTMGLSVLGLEGATLFELWSIRLSLEVVSPGAQSCSLTTFIDNTSYLGNA